MSIPLANAMIILTIRTLSYSSVGFYNLTMGSEELYSLTVEDLMMSKCCHNFPKHMKHELNTGKVYALLICLQIGHVNIPIPLDNIMAVHTYT